ncbi:uncharacterized protein BDZ99DRAFT_383189 [Mytilinidion resinicola]|uniref:Aminoglycoside phosphotransferase domain-containing protein n=1 Tax=Mytilinidion resinicola TaxID=574789 RepID=A0A6A6YW14_9PEZI|nr:uncharacterized protein BDZ99DRAFT_383189 [Mytilinidion resinicola]KAF2812184.1 hypothetical protein BDZ99DRAFT_383189 [Mytilinidion resinicola]
MPAMIELDSGPITYEDAVDSEDNVIDQLAYFDKTKKLFDNLWHQKRSIEDLTAHHLGLGWNDICIVQDRHAWIRGTFNICIPVEIKSGGRSSTVIMRCPMPHKLAEARYSGTVDEKLSCEVGTYAWMQANSPDISIPHLVGFGFSDGRHYTHAIHRPFYVRFAHIVRRHLYAFLRYPLLSQYTHNPTIYSLHTGYMILEFIGPSRGQMLSDSWTESREDSTKKKNLFRGIARLMLSLARVPQLRIGSFRYHDDGSISLSNRPLSCSTIILENDGASRIMHRSDTYTCTEAFVSDMLTFHDHRFLNQSNAAYDEEDCRGQMAVKTLLRTLSHHYLRRELRNGPFILQFTDFHASNIIVDQEWNITCLIDLEWVCSLPAEQLAVPYWLTGKKVDQIRGEHLHEFNRVLEEFMIIFEEEEQRAKVSREHDTSLAKIMHDMWESKGVWFWYCIESVNSMHLLLEHQLCPRFSGSLSTKAEEIISQFWCEGSASVVVKKLAEKEGYDQELVKLFIERATDASGVSQCI